MPPQFGIKLSVHIISSHFGNLVAKVCECLLRKGALTRSAIVFHTGLAPDKVTKCLLVLIQHNCVQAFEPAMDANTDPEKIKTHYFALFDNIICRMRFPKFLTVVSKELDKECAFVLEGLLQHGRLTLTQILDRANDLLNEGECVRERFMKLLEARCIERCPVAEPVVVLAPEPKKGSSSKKILQKEGTLEDRVLAASTLMEAERFSIMTNTGKDIAEENRSNGSNKMKVGNKRKHNVLEVDGQDLDISDCENDPTWRVNFDEFKRLFRKKACVESTKASLDDGADVVLNAVLEASKATGNTVSLSLNGIYEEVIKSEEGRTMTLEHVRKHLLELGCDEADDASTDHTCTFDLTKILEDAQREEIGSIVSKRYGKDAFRLYNSLANNGGEMETSKISGSTLLDNKDTKKILYKLWIDNFLHMESAKRPPQGEVYHWRVNQNLNGLVLDELFHVALNLRIRVAHEMELGREVYNLQGSQKSDDAKKRLVKLRTVKKLLDSSLAKLDDAIMLFHDF